VVLAGGVLGPRLGAAALVAYLALGALGLPVFTDGVGGIARLWGPTGGYLAGFVVGAWLAGRWADRAAAQESPGIRAVVRLCLGLGLAHLVILGLGWARLALLMGAEEAFTQGVAPFLWGGAVKSVVGAVLLVGWCRVRARGAPESPSPRAPEPSSLRAPSG
jgi:biotin transport system substrate-specific component